MQTSKTRRLYLVIAGIALVALAFGSWDAFVERDGGENLLWQVGLPILLLVTALAMAREGGSDASAEEPAGQTDEVTSEASPSGPRDV